MIKVIIADDHKMFRQGMRMMLEMEPDIKVAGEAQDGMEIQEMAKSTLPDVILMDINMPVMDGVRAAEQITRFRPDSKIIILTMFSEDEHVFQAIQAGAKGYLLKDSDGAEVLRAIRLVASGASILDPALTAKVFSQLKILSSTSERADRQGLTSRELDVLGLIAQGASNREIGKRLFLSEKTIKNYISSIFQKLQFTDRTQAAVYALHHGLAGEK